MFDQHVHSNFSFDSNEDLENPVINYKDSSIHYLKYIEQIKNLNKKYPNKFFSGIEIGYTPNSEKRIEDFLKNKDK